MLTSCDISSLVVNSLRDQAAGENVAVAYLYFDFTVQKERSSTSVLGAIPKQIVN